jgi:6-phospho-beta-glucosidase
MMLNGNPAKIVVLGGSGVATPDLAAALVNIPNRQRGIHLVLHGRAEEKLAKVAGIARILAGSDPLLEISYTTDINAALEGAEIILNQIRVGGLEARAFDESFPQELGLPGEETVGPGGFANASRTIPVVLEYAHKIEQICPEARLLTFANPSSLVQYAITRYTKVNAIGLCDGPVTICQNVARALQLPVQELVIDYVGMHHFGWVTGVWHHGRNLLPEAIAHCEVASPDVDPAIVRALGVIPGLYLNYVFHPDRMLAKKMGKRTRAEELIELQDELLSEYTDALAEGKAPQGLAKRKARWYQAIIAPVMIALVEERTERFYMNVINRQVNPWLPAEAIVETACLVEKGHVQPLAAPEAPAMVRTLVQTNCAYEMLAVQGIVEHDRAKALQALLINPIIHTYEQAAGTLEKAWGQRERERS